MLFHIVDPASLWIEALLFDPLDPSAIKQATAEMPDGTIVQLAYKGRGRALQAQAALIQFSMNEPPPSALIGLPVTVYVRSARRSSGILLPREAVVRGAGGEGVVWQHVDPERFVARPVRVEPFDGAQVVVTAGIGAKDRIVVHAAELLSQIR